MHGEVSAELHGTALGGRWPAYFEHCHIWAQLSSFLRVGWGDGGAHQRCSRVYRGCGCIQ